MERYTHKREVRIISSRHVIPVTARATSFRFFVSDVSQKEKDRNPRVNTSASVTSWFPVFFGQGHTGTEGFGTAIRH